MYLSSALYRELNIHIFLFSGQIKDNSIKLIETTSLKNS